VVIANYGFKYGVRFDCVSIDLIVQFGLSKYVEFLEGVHDSPFFCNMNDVHYVIHMAHGVSVVYICPKHYGMESTKYLSMF
jgi:hypothetical protein